VNSISYQQFADKIHLSVTLWETSYLNTGMYKSDSSQSHESRSTSAGSSKACSKPTAFDCRQLASFKKKFKEVYLCWTMEWMQIVFSRGHSLDLGEYLEVWICIKKKEDNLLFFYLIGRLALLCLFELTESTAGSPGGEIGGRNSRGGKFQMESQETWVLRKTLRVATFAAFSIRQIATLGQINSQSRDTSASLIQ